MWAKCNRILHRIKSLHGRGRRAFHFCLRRQFFRYLRCLIQNQNLRIAEDSGFFWWILNCDDAVLHVVAQNNLCNIFFHTFRQGFAEPGRQSMHHGRADSMPPVRYCVSYSSYEVLFSLNKGYIQTGQRPVQCLHGHLILLSDAVKVAYADGLYKSLFI